MAAMPNTLPPGVAPAPLDGRFNFADVMGAFDVDPARTLVEIRGQVKTVGRDVVVAAAAPPHRTTSYSGSGLPYPSPDVAAGQRVVARTAPDGSFACTLHYPSASYARGGAYVPPHFTVGTTATGTPSERAEAPPASAAVPVGPGVAFRLQAYPTAADSHVARCSPLFYGNHPYLPPGRTQEQILRDSAYTPYRVPPNFWGLCPAH